jgi:hypothetical protein
MSTVYLERLRAISEARRAAYATARGTHHAVRLETQPQLETPQPEHQPIKNAERPAERPAEPQMADMLKQIQECHKAVLQDEKIEHLQNTTQIYVHNKMREIMSMIADLILDFSNFDLSNENLIKSDDQYKNIIKKITATVNFIYNLNQLPQLRRVYQCGEIIHALYYISETPDNINVLYDRIQKLNLVIKYMAYFTRVIAHMQNIVPQVIFTRSEQLQAIIRTLTI